MKYLLLLVLLWPNPATAQANVVGLGPYRIGETTPDSLKRTDFIEDDPSLVKGTLTLVCSHIRTFKSSRVNVAGVFLTNLSLAFYDNHLFTLSCDYSDTLKEAFLSKHGPGIAKPPSRVILCSAQTNKPLLVWDETWQNADVLARVVHVKGYAEDCRRVESVRLIITSQRDSALSSDCDVKSIEPFPEAFRKVAKEHQPR